MELFKVKNEKLITVTKFGEISHSYSQAQYGVVDKITFKEGYEDFVNQFYAKGITVIGANERAYIMRKKDIYAAKVNIALNGVSFVKYSDWKKVNNLRAEFKSIAKAIGLKFKKEQKVI